MRLHNTNVEHRVPLKFGFAGPAICKDRQNRVHSLTKITCSFPGVPSKARFLVPPKKRGGSVCDLKLRLSHTNAKLDQMLPRIVDIYQMSVVAEFRCGRAKRFEHCSIYHEAPLSFGSEYQLVTKITNGEFVGTLTEVEK